MSRISGFSKFGAIVVAAVALVSMPAHGYMIDVDEIIFSSEGGTDPSKLSGTVDMSYDATSNELSISLTNTSTAGASTEPASLLLTGLGFNLGAYSISSGTVTIGTSSSTINFPGTFSGDDVSQEWGFANEPTGPFQPVPGGQLSDGSVDAVLSSLIAAVTEQFAPGSIDATPPHLNGPDFGLLSSNEPSSAAGGQEAIQDSVDIVLALSGPGTSAVDLISFIDNNHVVLSFGSPDMEVSEPGILALLGLGLVGLGLMGRYRATQKI